MRAEEFTTEAVRQRLDPKCWKGKHKEGTKIKGGVRVNNCVPNESQELDEIDRRGFLKGLGAAAVAGAAGYKMGQGSAPEAKKKYFNPRLWYLCGYLDTTSLPGRYEPDVAMSILSEVNGILRDTNDWNSYVEENQKGHSQWWKDLDAVREKLGLPPFKQEPLNQNKELFRPWMEQRSSSVFKEIKKLVGYKDFDESVQQGVAEELSEEFDLIESAIENLANRNAVDAEVIWEDLESLTDDELYVFAVTQQPIMETEAWQKANKKDKTDGMSRKAVKTYRREHPGSKLQTAVTTKPSKLKKGSKASKRRKSYCSRSKGQMKMHNISCAKTPDKAICKARRRWNC